MAVKSKSATGKDDTVLGIKISHPEKELWPKSKLGPAVTKLDLARYMADAAQKMLPHIASRPGPGIGACTGLLSTSVIPLAKMMMPATITRWM